MKIFHKQKAVSAFDCPRCKRNMGAKDALQEHLAVDNNSICTFQETPSSQDPEDGINTKIEDLLNGRRANSKVDTWEILWQTLFPDDPQAAIPDPAFVPPIELDEVYDFHAQQCREDLRRRISDEELSGSSGSDQDLDNHIGKMVDICEKYIEYVFKECREVKIGNLPGQTRRKRVQKPRAKSKQKETPVSPQSVEPPSGFQRPATRTRAHPLTRALQPPPQPPLPPMLERGCQLELGLDQQGKRGGTLKPPAPTHADPSVNDGFTIPHSITDIARAAGLAVTQAGIKHPAHGPRHSAATKAADNAGFYAVSQGEGSSISTLGTRKLRDEMGTREDEPKRVLSPVRPTDPRISSDSSTTYSPTQPLDEVGIDDEEPQKKKRRDRRNRSLDELTKEKAALRRTLGVCPDCRLRKVTVRLYRVILKFISLLTASFSAAMERVRSRGRLCLLSSVATAERLILRYGNAARMVRRYFALVVDERLLLLGRLVLQTVRFSRSSSNTLMMAL